MKSDERHLRDLFGRVLGCVALAGCGSSASTSADAGTRHVAGGHGEASTHASTNNSGSHTAASTHADASATVRADAAIHDSGRDGHSGQDTGVVFMSCPEPAFCSNGVACAPGCSLSETCVDGGWECSCSCKGSADAGLSCTPDATTPCNSWYLADTCLDASLPHESGASIPLAECQTLCKSATVAYCGETIPGGQPGIICGTCLSAGRRPAGFAPRRTRSRDALQRYLATAADLEAASVTAFQVLASELTAHGAPRELVALAKAAERDERRHARVMRSLAARGVRPMRKVAARRRPAVTRSLEAIALENAVEGCARETFGALVATYQATHAEQPALRAAMVGIAEDETRHAALAWAVAGWAESRLDVEARERVRHALRSAAREIASDVLREPPHDVLLAAGLPRAGEASRMAQELGRELWGLTA